MTRPLLFLRLGLERLQQPCSVQQLAPPRGQRHMLRIAGGEALAKAERSRVPEYRKAADDAARTFFESQKKS